MTTVNTALAGILDGFDTFDSTDSGNDPLLAAVLDAGVFVPEDESGSVIYVDEAGEPALPGYVSEECLAEQLPQAARAVHYDAMRLIDTLRRTGVEKVFVSSTGGWATLPADLLLRTLRQHGTRTRGDQSVVLRWSTHPLALALREGLRQRLLDFPGIGTVWIADARWDHSGVEQLLVHIAVGPDAAPDAARRLMETLLAEHVTVGADDPVVAAISLDPVTEADRVRGLDAAGLDTVRADHALRRIEVVSREFDAAPPAPAGEPRPRRWWRRS